MRRAWAILIVSMGCTRHDSGSTQDAGAIAETPRTTSVSTADVDASARAPDRVENDDKLTDNWCLDPKDFTPTKRVLPPFTVSAADAVQAVMSSNHFAALRKAHPGAAVDLMSGFGCARRCAKPDHECGFQMRASDYEATSESSLLEWFAVDPVTKVVWFQDFSVDGGPWKSEAPH
jgi:hypothetical protein